MKVLIKTVFSPQNLGTIIIPILKNDALNGALENIAASFGVSAERLKADLKGDLKEMTHFYSGQTRISLLGLGEKPTANDVLLATRNLSVSQKTKFNGGAIAFDFTHGNLDENFSIKSRFKLKLN